MYSVMINKFWFRYQKLIFPSMSYFQEYQYSTNHSKSKFTPTFNSNFPPKESKESNLSKTKSKPKTLSSLQSPIQTLLKIQTWRKTHEAPVDIVGAQSLIDKTLPVQLQKYQSLISIMLSIQTKDETTAMVMTRLRHKITLKPQIVSEMKEQDLTALIYECNYNKRKAKNIKEVSRMIRDHGMAKGKEELLAYPGVGMKIANVYLQVVEGRSEGIGVDTHVHRISNRLGWVNASTPDKTEEQLVQVFPRKYWSGINSSVVGFGQILCAAKKPKCQECPVAKQCPSFSLEW